MGMASEPQASSRPASNVTRIIFVGASTGGTEAVKQFLQGIPCDCPPILVVQHMPESFTGSFAARLNSLSHPRVIEAKGNEVVEAGTVYIAPGHSHLRIRRSGVGYLTELLSTPPVNRHRPSVDVLFDSAAEVVGRNAIGVILTGMGKDGANGLLRMRRAGARTFGQDEASCVRLWHAARGSADRCSRGCGRYRRVAEACDGLGRASASFAHSRQSVRLAVEFRVACFLLVCGEIEFVGLRCIRKQ